MIILDVPVCAKLDEAKVKCSVEVLSKKEQMTIHDESAVKVRILKYINA